MSEKITHAMLPLVKYECGCIGFAPDPDSGDAVLMKACDREIDDPPIHLFVRNMKHKVFITWDAGSDSLKQPGSFFQDLRRVVRDGYLWQQLKRDLKC